ncbi:choice-of-anchor B domain-containing protein [Ekhidna lutea]|uniref:Choice-of-anchor B domain-containing protein n=1 Tax=Ekhidna lutea TaxID=447679 RepID=A0A239EXV9_EKHLU|nr:choice-of-anchor B family protein [Ekhidna lutea]SNS49590.1 choice-of-anchor B domain-containing protein [Ekhidna lutea]
MKNLLTLFTLISFFSYSQTPCEDGKAGQYDCFGIDLQSHITAPDLGAEEHNGRWINDIWGWVDPDNGREYALVGMTNGTSFVDITDPVNPVVMGVLIEHNSQNTTTNQTLHDEAKSVWRDIKVYQNHAYIVSEDSGHGLQVFDLTDLRDVASPSKDHQFAEAGHYDGIGKAHNIVINEETGFAYAVGANEGSQCSGGGLHIIDLSDPKNPVFAGCFDEDGYTHDAQCVIYNGPDPDYQGMEICFNSNEDEVTIVNVNDKSDISIVSKGEYDAQYTHQGWLTEDHKYFLSNDELDEYYLSRNTRTFIWDVQDLDNPTLLGYYEHGTQAIDHNLYVKDNYVYESNYANGLRILDTTGISQGSLHEEAFFDTFVSSDVTDFIGTWSNYPYFPSGNIAVSDITNGLFVLKQKSFYIVDQPTNVETCVGAHLDIPINVVGTNLEFQWQVDDGSGFKNIDDFERYKNTQTTMMHAHTLEQSQSGNQYRCIISNGESELTSDVMTLHVLDTPKADFTYELDDISGEIIFTNSSLHATDFEWAFGDGGHSFLETPMHQYQEEGMYEVILIATNGCTSDTLTQSIELVILSASDELSDYNIYPTVVDEVLTIESNSKSGFTYGIFSLQGNQLMKKQVYGSSEKVNLSKLVEGLYILNIQSGNRIISRKIVVER